MEAKYIRRRRYSLRFQASSFFLLALLVRLSWLIVSGTEALGAEVLAIEDALAVEALATE